mmetsp:Transcript_40304/g.104469  ORF Transcript_40304/g.104469 Transcript_40304/m.104469 type:complete len:987 (-) Transcript_40304:323-3283(-)
MYSSWRQTVDFPTPAGPRMTTLLGGCFRLKIRAKKLRILSKTLLFCLPSFKAKGRERLDFAMSDFACSLSPSLYLDKGDIGREGAHKVATRPSLFSLPTSLHFSSTTRRTHTPHTSHHARLHARAQQHSSVANCQASTTLRCLDGHTTPSVKDGGRASVKGKEREREKERREVDKKATNKGRSRGEHGERDNEREREREIMFPLMPSSVSCGRMHTLALSENGEVFGWGSNVNNMITTESDEQAILQPRRISCFDRLGVVAVAAGSSHSLALTTKGNVWAWGAGGRGLLGHNADDLMHHGGVPPAPLVFPSFSSAPLSDSEGSDGVDERCARKEDAHHDGRGGLSVVLPPNVRQSLGRVFIIKIACGEQSSAAVSDEGVLFTWGRNDDGLLGHTFESMGIVKPTVVDALVSSNLAVVDVKVGWRHMLALTDSGEMYAWGRAREGQLGVGDVDAQWCKPKKVIRTTNDNDMWASISCGYRHSAAVTSSGSVYTWGRGKDGQLGNGLLKEKETYPLAVSMDYFEQDDKVISVHCGADFSLAQTRKGKVYRWGKDSVRNKAIPYPLMEDTISDEYIRVVSAGFQHACYITSQQRHAVYANGQLQQYSASPVLPDSMKEVDSSMWMGDLPERGIEGVRRFQSSVGSAAASLHQEEKRSSIRDRVGPTLATLSIPFGFDSAKIADPSLFSPHSGFTPRWSPAWRHKVGEEGNGDGVGHGHDRKVRDFGAGVFDIDGSGGEGGSEPSFGFSVYERPICLVLAWASSNYALADQVQQLMQRAAPLLTSVGEEGTVRLFHVNLDKHPAWIFRYRIASLPTFFLFQNGLIYAKIVGVPAVDELVDVVCSAVAPLSRRAFRLPPPPALSFKRDLSGTGLIGQGVGVGGQDGREGGANGGDGNGQDSLLPVIIRPSVSVFRKDCEGVVACDRHSRPLTNGETYYVGIVDVTQTYNLKKQGEHLLKVLKKPSARRKISAVETSEYRSRFLDFMQSITE